MGMQGDVYAVTVGSDTNFYVESVTPTGAGALTLANTRPGLNGIGYQVIVTCAGNDAGRTFTVVGLGMDGNVLTEEISGADAGATTGSSYFAEITSISVDDATDGAVTIGYGGNLALPKTRVKYVYFVSSASAGTVTLTRNSDSAVILNIPTPATANTTDGILMPGDGISTAYVPADYSVVTLSNVTATTFICG